MSYEIVYSESEEETPITMGCKCSKDDSLAIRHGCQDLQWRPLHKGSSERIENHVVAAVTTTREEKKQKQIKSRQLGGQVGIFDTLGFDRIPKAVIGELVTAGWPTWLANVAGEAIRGWIPQSRDKFDLQNKIGHGSYSVVYKARDIERHKFVALKRIELNHLDPQGIKFMAREILVLRRLDHPNIIKLEGVITSQSSGTLYLIFEHMDHDLSEIALISNFNFTESQIKCYTQQLLNGLDHCHSQFVLHRDIKCSNLFIGKNGVLKIGDFGLASLYDPQNLFPLTSHVVTRWYRPPELILKSSHYGGAVDLWSSGCILAELFMGRPVFPGKSEIEQLQRIFKLCGSPPDEYWDKFPPSMKVLKSAKQYKRCIVEYCKHVPPAAVSLIDTFLSIDPAGRGTAASALNSEFFMAEPLACNSSILPEYPWSEDPHPKSKERRKGIDRCQTEPPAISIPRADVPFTNSKQKVLSHQQTTTNSFLEATHKNIDRKSSYFHGVDSYKLAEELRDSSSLSSTTINSDLSSTYPRIISTDLRSFHVQSSLKQIRKHCEQEIVTCSLEISSGKTSTD